MKKYISLFFLLMVFFLVFSGVSLAASTVDFSNPLKYDTASSFLDAVLTNIRSLVVVLSLVFIVIGAIMYMISAGNENMIKKAKATITAAAIGFAISISAETFLKEIWTITGATVESPSSSVSFYDIANNALKFLLSIVGVLGIIGMVIGGMMYMTAYGDEKKATQGRTVLMYSIIGVVIALGAVIIIQQISSVVSGS